MLRSQTRFLRSLRIRVVGLVGTTDSLSAKEVGQAVKRSWHGGPAVILHSSRAQRRIQTRGCCCTSRSGSPLNLENRSLHILKHATKQSYDPKYSIKESCWRSYRRVLRTQRCRNTHTFKASTYTENKVLCPPQSAVTARASDFGTHGHNQRRLTLEEQRRRKREAPTQPYS